MTSAQRGFTPDCARTVEELYENAPCGFLVAPIEGLVSWVNATFLDWTGYRRENLVGVRRFDELLTPGGRIFYETHFAPLLQLQGQVKSVVLDLIRVDGEVLPVLIHAVGMTVAPGTSPWMHISIFDATERRRYEQELLDARRAAERSDRRVRILHRIVAETALAGDRDTVADTVATTLHEMFVAGVAVWLFDEARTKLIRASSAGLPDSAPTIVPSDSALPPAEACRRGDVATGPGRWIAVPVCAGEMTLGAYTLHFRREHDLDEDELQLLRTVGSHAGQALVRAASQHRLRAVLESFADAVLAVDADHRVTYANARAAELIGAIPADLVGRSLREAFGDYVNEDCAAPLAAALAGTLPAPVEVWQPQAKLYFELQVYPSEDWGATVRLSDVTSRVRLAAALRELDEFKDGFLRTVAHDLRTPLTVIAGLATILQEDPESHPELSISERCNFAGRIAVAADRLNGFVTDLLDLDRFTQGKHVADRRPTDIAALVHRVVAAVEVPDHPIRASVPPVTADIDPAQLERILENLIANAVRHTPAGTSIRVGVADGPEGLLVSVEDAGPGVPDDLKSTIFEPYMCDSNAGGTGVGLSVVAAFAGLHGGKAWVEDRPGGGASFRVLLGPAQDAPETGPSTPLDPVGRAR